MLFVIGLIIFICVACATPIDLALPLCAIILRAGYLRRDMALIQRGALFIALVFVAAPVLFSAAQLLMGRPVDTSLDAVLVKPGLLAGSVYLTAIMLLNLRGDPTVVGSAVLLGRAFRPFGALAHHIERYPEDLLQRMKDIWYAFTLRYSASGGSRRAIDGLRLLKAFATACILEMVSVANRLALVVDARGEVPPISWWKFPEPGWRAVVAADALMLCALVVIARLMHIAQLLLSTSI